MGVRFLVILAVLEKIAGEFILEPTTTSKCANDCKNNTRCNPPGDLQLAVDLARNNDNNKNNTNTPPE